MSIDRPQFPEPTILRPTVLDIDLDALVHNYGVIKQRVSPARVMAVVKANAYGHGLIACARTLEQVGVDALGVALLEEGIALRQAGITKPILVFGGILGTQIKYFLEYDLELTASSVSKLEAIDQTAKECGRRARAHLKIDTGMERLGVHYYSASTLFEKALSCNYCDIVGVFSHLATSGDRDTQEAKIQLNRFDTALQFYRERSLTIPPRHIANSGGVIQLPESYLDMVRPGIALYGVYPEAHLSGALDLKPVMKLSSHVVYFKVVKRGAGVGYGYLWRAARDCRVVTAPIGYGDGYFRNLSNRGEVLIRGRRFPIVGSVCMDQIMVNIDDGEAYNGDEVTLIGRDGSEVITVEQVAQRAGTIPYEVLTALNSRVPRRYHLAGKQVEFQ